MSLRSRLPLLALLSLAGLSTCGPRQPGAKYSEFRGPGLPQPIAKPEFVLTGTDGKPFNFRAETDGYSTLLFFGYTHCPDVCPLHMANIAHALHQLGPSVQSKVKVVFVTTDPARDTPERLRSWLANFDSTFIGLAGPIDTIYRITDELHMARAYREVASDTGSRPPTSDTAYTIGHMAMVLAFTTDNLAHFVYPLGVTQDDWANDLAKMAQGPPREQ